MELHPLTLRQYPDIEGCLESPEKLSEFAWVAVSSSHTPILCLFDLAVSLLDGWKFSSRQMRSANTVARIVIRDFGHDHGNRRSIGIN